MKWWNVPLTLTSDTEDERWRLGVPELSSLEDEDSTFVDDDCWNADERLKGNVSSIVSFLLFFSFGDSRRSSKDRRNRRRNPKTQRNAECIVVNFADTIFFFFFRHNDDDDDDEEKSVYFCRWCQVAVEMKMLTRDACMCTWYFCLWVSYFVLKMDCYYTYGVFVCFLR